MIRPRFLALSAILLGYLAGNPSLDAKSPASHSHPILKVIQDRHSGRSYDESRPVSAGQIQALMEAARWAPSCYGDEPWRFIVCSKETHPQAYEKVLGSLVEFNQNWACHAPLLIVAVARTEFKTNGKENRWGAYDTGAASENLLLQATALGLMGHPMGGFDEEKLKASFGIEGPYTIMSVIAVGYEHPTPPAEEKNRTRQPLETLVFEGAWKGDTP